MKKFSEFKANLTYRKAQTYSAIIAIILTTIVCISIIAFMEEVIITSIVVSSPLAICLYLTFLLGIFQAHKLGDKERFERAKQRVLLHYTLTKEQYTKVNYIYDQSLDRIMFEKMLEFFDFYVKLNDNEEIELVVKDKNDNIVFTKTTDNFIYFEAHFKMAY